MEALPTREQALEILHEHTKSDSLRKHAYGVEAVMKAFAEKHGDDARKFSLVGLLHDFDYEMYPNAPDHPLKGSEILRARNFPEEIVYAIQCHADYVGNERRSLMDKAIFALDELTGFIVACTLVKPSKSLSEIEPKSVRKKLKDKAFARSVHREDIYKGAEQLGVELDELIIFVAQALKPVATEIGINP
ncbi:HDIG domain-containing protein [bacterium]|nr:HDIG domain-containing protein [bacterium]MCI0602466.1 HDIG domain-containing protein [bacterium]